MSRRNSARYPATSLPTASLAGCARFHRMFNRPNDADIRGYNEALTSGLAGALVHWLVETLGYGR
jgi:hypothetical protein